MNMSIMLVDMLVSSLINACVWTQRKWFEKTSDRMNDRVNAESAKCNLRIVGKRQAHSKLFN